MTYNHERRRWFGRVDTATGASRVLPFPAELPLGEVEIPARRRLGFWSPRFKAAPEPADTDPADSGMESMLRDLVREEVAAALAACGFHRLDTGSSETQETRSADDGEPAPGTSCADHDGELASRPPLQNELSSQHEDVRAEERLLDEIEQENHDR